MVKHDGCVADSRRRRCVQAAELDERPNRLVEATDRWTVTNAKGECLTITMHEVVSDTSWDLGVDPGLSKDGVEAHLQALLAATPSAIEDGLTLVRREYPTAIGPVDLVCRDPDGDVVAIEVKRRGEIDGVEQLVRYIERLRLDTSLGDVRGVFVAQGSRPQARCWPSRVACAGSRSTTTICAAWYRATCDSSDGVRLPVPIRLTAMPHTVRGVVAKAKGEPVVDRDDRRTRSGSRRSARQGPGVRRLPHRPALPRGRHQRRLPVPARARGGGVVEEVGDGVTDVAVGDFVILNWRAVCGRCRSCRRGQPWYCFDTFNAQQKMTLEDGTELSLRSGSAPSPTRPSSRPVSARRSMPRRRRRWPGCSVAG